MQRDWLSDAEAAVSALGKDVTGGAEAAARAIKLAESAIVDPTTIPAMLVQLGWDSLSPSVQALVIDRILEACTKLVPAIGPAIDALSPGLPIGQLLASAASGFLSRAQQYDNATKVRVVNRFVQVWANPSATFTLSFLKGLILGVWDGIKGPFVLIWDLVKLEWALVQAEGHVIATLADTAHIGSSSPTSRPPGPRSSQRFPRPSRHS